jgi:hypothetical protein
MSYRALLEEDAVYEQNDPGALPGSVIKVAALGWRPVVCLQDLLGLSPGEAWP